MSEPIHLSQEEARSMVLSRQGLAHKGRYAEPGLAMHALVAVQTQYPASLAAALAARAEKVTARSLERLLAIDKRFLKGWTFRSTLHTSLSEDHMLALAMLGPQLIERHASWIGNRGIDRAQLEELHGQIYCALAKGPLGRRELHEVVPHYKGMPMVGWGLDVMGLAAEGKVVLSRQAAAGTEFARLDIWAPFVQACPLSRTEAAKELARRYYSGYGPATHRDFIYWAGLRVRGLGSALKEVREELTAVRIEGRTETYFVFGNHECGMSSTARLLPKFDPLMMGRQDKSIFLPQELKGRVFRPAGQVEAVVLADGQVVGTWRTARKGKTLQFTVEPFSRLGKRALAALPREALRTAKALGFDDATLTV